MSGRSAAIAKREDDAVSEVIAIVLLVAIAITAAALIFVAFQIFGTPKETPIPVAFTSDEGNDRLVVEKTSDDANWARLRVQVSAHGGSATAIYMGDTNPYQNDPATFNGADILSAGRVVSGESAPIRSGEFIAFCADQATTDVQITVIDEASNSVIGRFNFLNIRLC